MENILSLKNIDKKFGYIHAVKNLSFDIKKGNIYGILGPNGSGKSTTLGIILNVVNKTSGTYSWFNGTVNNHDALKKVGAIIERPNFYPYMTAYQNLKLVCKIKNITHETIEEKLRLVNLYERKDSKFNTFSLGMKQRLAIASALLNNPEILILDEPTNGLDPQGIHEIREIIKVIANEGTTILLASHLLDEVEKICTHAVVIQNGQKLYEGKIDEITSTHGFIDLKSEDNDALVKQLKNINGIGEVSSEEGIITVQLTENMSAARMNRLLFDQGITVSHLIKRKPSLEQQFLSLTNNN